MSLSAKLQLGDNIIQIYNSEFAVIECGYTMIKKHDSRTRKIDANTARAEITLSVVVPVEGDFTLFSWYADRSMYSGRIVIDISSITLLHGEKSEKSIAFEDAYCIEIKESYDIQSNYRREMKLKLLATDIKIDEFEFTVNH